MNTAISLTHPKMRAILQPAYGLPDVLLQASVDQPALRPDGVMVQIVAVSLHKGDWHLLTGTPYLIRLAGFGVLKPKHAIPGMAIAGRVRAVGAEVSEFTAGDEVFGEISHGGFAEYVCVSAHELAHKPAGVSFEDAATLPVSATTALQGLRDAGLLQAGQSVLINGAAGGVGTFAVQIAKALGAEVTGVCSAKNTALVRSLGADHVVDYGAEDFTAGGARYDLILDLVGNQPASACRRVLKPGGRLVAVAGGAENRWMGPLVPILKGMAGNLFSRQVFVPLAAMPNREDLAAVAALVQAGKVKPVIEGRYTLDQVPEALAHLGLGHSRGKSVVTL
jgi:NADPH:quinone reductase-like Zn-dependent oxidoreductase